MNRKTDRFSGKSQCHFSDKSLVPPQIFLSSYAHVDKVNMVKFEDGDTPEKLIIIMNAMPLRLIDCCHQRNQDCQSSSLQQT